MKMRFIYLCLLVFVMPLLFSCGGNKKPDSNENNTNETNQNECVKDTKISLFVSKAGLKDSKSFVTANNTFNVQKQQYVLINDSTAEIKINGITKLKSGANNEVTIEIALYAKKGTKLNYGIYKNMDFDSNRFAKVSIKTDLGNIWFNWSSGMPDPGAVNIHQISSDMVCGSVNLNVEKPDNQSIGVVKLNGNFYISN